MLQFFSFFSQICLFRAGPGRAPDSNGVVGLVLGFYIICSTLLLSLSNSQNELGRSLQIVCLGILVQMSGVFILLFFKRLASRFKPTLVSFLGANSLMVICMLPLNLLLMFSESEMMVVLIETIYWGFFFWWIGIAGFILHKAMNVSVLLGTMLAFTLELLSLVATSSIIPSSVQTVS